MRVANFLRNISSERIQPGILMLTLAALFTTTAFAQSSGPITYTYSGNWFQLSPAQTWVASVSISMSLPAPLQINMRQVTVGPSPWTVSNGNTTLSSSDPQASFAAVLWTDSAGALASWQISGSNSTGLRIESCHVANQCNYDATTQQSSDGSTVFSGTISTAGPWTAQGGIPNSTLNRVGVFSHIAAGGGWSTVITLINNSSAAVPVTVTLHKEDGSAWLLPVTTTQQGSSLATTTSFVNATIASKATLLITTGDGIAATTAGWADVSSTASLSGFAIFRTSSPNSPISEGTVPIQTLFPFTLALPYDNTTGFVMGVALANLVSTAGTITATAWDSGGNLLGTRILSLPGNGHISFRLPDQIAPTAGKRGVVQFQSGTGGIGGLGLRFSPFGTFTSVPTI